MEKDKIATEKETLEIIKSKEELYFADDGMNEVIVRLNDIPDFIVDVNNKNVMTDLKFYKVNNVVISKPDIKTMGIFLDKISPKLREKIIDRLVKLQTGEAKIKNYKVIDEYLYEKVTKKLEKEQSGNKSKKKKLKEDR